MSKEIQKRINSLVKKLNKWNDEYYKDESPTVEDLVFDQSLNQLIDLEEEYPEYKLENSPTNKVGSSLTVMFTKKEHRYTSMLSLSNSFSHDDVLTFDKRVKKELQESSEIKYSIEPKIDGISISLFYQNGKLIEALTRGDGVIGEVVTNNVLMIEDIPHNIKYTGDVVIRGEIYMSNSNFDNINKERSKQEKNLFANPRNAASGTVRQLDSNVVKERKLNAFMYYAANNSGLIKQTQEEVLNFLVNNSFKVSDLTKISNNINEAILEMQKIEKLRETLDYEIDGLVIKVNDSNLYEEIGYTSKFPKWANAYKFPTQEIETKLLDIFPTIGRTGRVTYNAKLNPVTLLGTKVQAATLHNANYIESLDLKINDYVYVKKAGDIIPKVIGVNFSKRKNVSDWVKPNNCPVCHNVLKIYEDEVDQYCINELCPSRVAESLIHFCSRDAMNIDGLAEKQIKLFISKGWLNKISDIYKLENYKDEMILLDGYKQHSVNKLLESIERSKTNSLEKLIFGLGIRHIGKKTAIELAMLFHDMNSILNLDEETLLTKVDFGEVKTSAILKWIINPDNKELISLLNQFGVNLIYKGRKVVESKITNKIVVVTGSISGGTRDDIKKLLISYGASVATSPSKKTDILFVGKNASENKVIKAENAIIIDIDDINEINKYAEL